MTPSVPRVEPVCRRWRLSLAAVAVAALGACELIAHDGTPDAAAGCGTWRGGCPATIDYATVTTAPTLEAEARFPGNVTYAAGADRRQCRAFPTGCQLGGLAETIEERYLAPSR